MSNLCLHHSCQHLIGKSKIYAVAWQQWDRVIYSPSSGGKYNLAQGVDMETDEVLGPIIQSSPCAQDQLLINGTAKAEGRSV